MQYIMLADSIICIAHPHLSEPHATSIIMHKSSVYFSVSVNWMNNFGHSKITVLSFHDTPRPFLPTHADSGLNGIWQDYIYVGGDSIL